MIIGIDLAGKEENPTGVCILNNLKLEFKTIYTDEDILKEVNRVNPSVITIDAPLSLPKGRCCLEKNCQCSVGGHFRQAERDIRPYGRVLPLTFRGMNMLTLRGIKLSMILGKDFTIIETHPRTSQNMLGFKDLQCDLNRIFKLPINVTEHELDALLAALTGFLYVNECYLELGDSSEGTIIIPKNKECLKFIQDL